MTEKKSLPVLGNVETIVEIHSGENKGLWKIIKRIHVEGLDAIWQRYVLSKDTSKAGGEIIIEHIPFDAENLYIFKKYNEFEKNAMPLPPPSFLNLEEGMPDFQSFDQNPENEGWECSVDGVDAVHWEYANEDNTDYLQVYLLADSWVEIFTGKKLPISQVEFF
jgi:hypothetical protein